MEEVLIYAVEAVLSLNYSARNLVKLVSAHEGFNMSAASFTPKLKPLEERLKALPRPDIGERRSIGQYGL